jgi:hypothetical protein
VTDGFRVDRATVAAHAAELEALAERTTRAAALAQPLRRDAYGLVGQVFAGTADEASHTASRAVAELAESLRRQADGVRADVAAHAALDGVVAAVLQGLR